MAFSNFFVLLDDIATLLDDVAVMSKVAVHKTAGVLGDDLALNAQQVAGVKADRELPVIWAVAKGSLVNKAILVPLALMISLWLPAAITPMLMVGGLYLCFEGVEKLAHRWLHTPQEDAVHDDQLRHAVADPSRDLVAFEKDKIKGAIRTDFVLSAEIIVITLGTIASAPFSEKVLVMCFVAFFMTLAVYGIVAGIVRLDDFGFRLLNRALLTGYNWEAKLGQAIVAFAPALLRFLSVAGTLAMFLVGGSILGHGWPALHHAVTEIANEWAELGGLVKVVSVVVPYLVDLVVGLVAGAIALVIVKGFSKLRAAFAH
jgi:predicted DNA repair protein MutK